MWKVGAGLHFSPCEDPLPKTHVGRDGQHLHLSIIRMSARSNIAVANPSSVTDNQMSTLPVTADNNRRGSNGLDQSTGCSGDVAQHRINSNFRTSTASNRNDWVAKTVGDVSPSQNDSASSISVGQHLVVIDDEYIVRHDCRNSPGLPAANHVVVAPAAADTTP